MDGTKSRSAPAWAQTMMTTRRRRFLEGRFDEWRVSCEANPKYRVSVLEALDLQEDSKILMSPGTKEVNMDDDSLPKVLGDDRKHRSIIAIDQ